MAREKTFLDTTVIVAKTIELIDSAGYDHFTTRRLAGALGISVMTLYNYYDNREAILRDAVLSCFELLWVGLPEKLEPYFEGKRGSPLRAFMVLGEHLRCFAESRPRLYSFLFGADLMPLQRDKSIAERYGYPFRRIGPLIEDRGKIEEIHNRVFLFEVLSNSLVLNALRGRGDLSEEIFMRLLADAYEGLLAPYEALVIAHGDAPAASNGFEAYPEAGVEAE